MKKIFLALIIPVIFLMNTVVYSQVKIGIALPLMKNSEIEDDKKLGSQMLKGINDALEEYNKSNPVNKVTFIIEDTKRDQSTALQVINKLGSDSGVIAVFGPVFSSEIINNAGVAAFHKLPVITPTATQNGLAENNAFLFQLNPTYDIRARLLAKYAMNDLGMKNFALFSEDDYGKNFSQSFSDEIIKNGGSIVSEIYYTKNDPALAEKFEEMKKNLAAKDKFIDFGSMNKQQADNFKKHKIEFSYVDSLVNEKLIVSIYKLFGKNADRVVDSLGLKISDVRDVSRNIIFGIADAVYLPVSGAAEISEIAPNYFSANINLPILGTSDWNNQKILKENSMYLKDLTFECDFYLEDRSGDDLVNISDADIKNYYFGYDGMKLLLQEISEGNTTRQRMNDALENVKNFSGEHNNVTIVKRTNHELSVMSYLKGSLNKVKDYVY